MGRPWHNLAEQLYANDVWTLQCRALCSDATGTSPRAVAENSIFLLLSLPMFRLCRMFFFRGADGILGVDLHDIIILDTTAATIQSSRPDWPTKLRGGWILNSPVTGGVWGATEHTALRFFVGGENQPLKEARVCSRIPGQVLPLMWGRADTAEMGKMVCRMIGSVEYTVAAGGPWDLLVTGS